MPQWLLDAGLTPRRPSASGSACSGRPTYKPKVLLHFARCLTILESQESDVAARNYAARHCARKMSKLQAHGSEGCPGCSRRRRLSNQARLVRRSTARGTRWLEFTFRRPTRISRRFARPRTECFGNWGTTSSRWRTMSPPTLDLCRSAWPTSRVAMPTWASSAFVTGTFRLTTILRASPSPSSSIVPRKSKVSRGSCLFTRALPIRIRRMCSPVKAMADVSSRHSRTNYRVSAW